MILKPLEAISDPELLKSFKAIGSKAYYCRCDGPYNTQLYYYKEPRYRELYFCEDCINTCFCEDGNAEGVVRCVAEGMVVRLGETPPTAQSRVII